VKIKRGGEKGRKKGEAWFCSPLLGEKRGEQKVSVKPQGIRKKEGGRGKKRGRLSRSVVVWEKSRTILERDACPRPQVRPRRKKERGKTRKPTSAPKTSPPKEGGEGGGKRKGGNHSARSREEGSAPRKEKKGGVDPGRKRLHYPKRSTLGKKKRRKMKAALPEMLMAVVAEGGREPITVPPQPWVKKRRKGKGEKGVYHQLWPLVGKEGGTKKKQRQR